MVKLETDSGKKRSKKRTSSESLKSIDERNDSDLDSYVQPVMNENMNANANSTSNLAQESKEKKKRNKRSCKAYDHDRYDTQIMEQTDTISVRNSSDEHCIHGNQDKLEKVESDLEQALKGPFLDNENTPSVELSVGQEKRRRKKRRVEEKGNDKDGMDTVDQIEIMSVVSLAVQEKEDELNRVDAEVAREIEEVLGRKKKGRREKKMKEKANDEDSVLSMENLSHEHGLRGEEDNLKRIEHELDQEIGGSFLDDEKKSSAKRKKKGRQRKMEESGNDNQSMDQADTMSIGSISVEQHGVWGEEDNLKRVENELEQEECVGKKKKGKEKKMKEKGNDEDKLKRIEDDLEQVVEKGSIIDVEQKKERKEKRRGNAIDKDRTESMDKVDFRSMGSLERSKRAEERSRPVFSIPIFDENTTSDDEDIASAKEQKRASRRRKHRQANDEACTQILDRKDIMSIQSVSDEQHLEENRVKPKGVDGKSEQKEEGTVVNDENIPAAKGSEEPKNKKKKRKKKNKNKNRDANADNVVESKDKNVDNLLMGSNLSIGKNLGLFSKRKLLVLDINGLLADIIYPAPKNCRPDAKVARRAIFKRPFHIDFLNFCFERFDVGIWSSRTKKIFNHMVDYLLGKLKHKLLFCWDVSYCTVSGFKTLENVHKPLVFKELRKIWENSTRNLRWEKGYYNESNTLLLDDSPYKALINPKNTAIFPPSFTFRNTKDNSLGPGGDIRVYLEKVAEAENIQKYVEEHPFGQVGIDETSESWDFYSKVLSRQSVALPSTTQNGVCIPA